MEEGVPPTLAPGRPPAWPQLCARCGAARPRSGPGPAPRAHLDSADQSFLPTDMLPEPRAVCSRPAPPPPHLRAPPRRPGRVTWPPPRPPGAPPAAQGRPRGGIPPGPRGPRLQPRRGADCPTAAGRTAGPRAPRGGSAAWDRREGSCPEPVGPALRPAPASARRRRGRGCRGWGGDPRTGSGRAPCRETDLAKKTRAGESEQDRRSRVTSSRRHLGLPRTHRPHPGLPNLPAHRP